MENCVSKYLEGDRSLSSTPNSRLNINRKVDFWLGSYLQTSQTLGTNQFKG